ncbi:MAG: AraC family transcriptional regulator [Bacteroides sp.]|nr:AraC family transcriptional regulator [Bacteroides sp.]
MDKQDSYLNELSLECRDKAGLFLCTSGSAEALLNSQKYHLQPGMLCVLSPLITWYLLSQTEDFGGIYIVDDLSVFYAVVRSNVDTLLHLKVRNNPCVMVDEQAYEFVVERKKLLEQKQWQLENAETDEEKGLIRQMIHLYEQETMLEVFGIYFRRTKVEAKPLEKNEAIVYNFIYSLHLHFKNERSVAFYAAEAHLSTNYFTTLIKQKTELTPSEWIVAITTSHAKLQLTKTQKSIKEIAEELNFPEQFTFRKYFKQYVGMPPKEYRQQFQKQK